MTFQQLHSSNTDRTLTPTRVLLSRTDRIRNRIHAVLLLPAAICCLINGGAVAADAPIGWAAVSGKGVESTTGGGDGEVVVARTIEELADHAGSSEPLTILVKGTLSGESVRIASNKTILGVGDDATLTGVELSMNGVSNIIIRNLKISGGRDGISARKTHHVWIDHCDVSDCDDGAIDITRESDFHTVSWTRLSDHHKTMLINGGSTHFSDRGTLNTTVHHCWFDKSKTRNPRVGFGKVHIFNCLYNGNGYCIGLHSECLVRAERNYFHETKSPIRQMYREDPADPAHGFCESVDNIFKNCSGAQDDEGRSFPVGDYYLYDFALNDVADVPDIVKSKAGPAAEFGTLGPLPVPGNGAVNVSLKPTLRWTKGQEAKSYQVAFGPSDPPAKTIETNEQTFTTNTLKPRKVYYWRVDQVTEEGVIEGEVWRFRTQEGR
jgi:pectate lyase